MKRFLMVLLAAVSAVMLISCEGNEGGEVGGGEVTPPTTGTDGFYEFPLNVQEDGFDAADNGVSINVADLKDNNIIFNLVPGKAVKSYRVEIYPKAMLYNFLLNEGCLDGTQADCEDKIIQLIKSGSGSGAAVFNSTYDDFSEKEFDWVNADFTSAVIVPDCEYYIMLRDAGLTPSGS